MDLTLVATVDLIVELKKRYDAVVFLGRNSETVDQTRQKVSIVTKGDLFSCESMARQFTYMANDALAEDFMEYGNEDEE